MEIFKDQVRREIILLKHLWPTLVVVIIAQYVHSIFTNLVYYLYDYYRVFEQDQLVDLGFNLLSPEIDKEKWGWTSETITFLVIGWAILFGSTVFFLKRETPLYAVHILHRALSVITIAFVIRIVSFLVTLLPASSEFCFPSDPDYNPPTSVIEILFRLDLFTGCGDLVFSSHTTYTTVCSLLYVQYGTKPLIKVILGILVFGLGLLIVAFRKHYTLDVWLAWTIAPMVYELFRLHFPDYYPEELRQLEQNSIAELQDLEKLSRSGT